MFGDYALGFSLTIAFIVVIAIIFLIVIIKNLLYICQPNEVLIFSGKKRKLSDGTAVGYRVIKGGRGIRVPFLEKVDKLDLSIMPIEVTVMNAYSKGGIPLKIQGIANVKIGSTEIVLNNAIERILEYPRDRIMNIAKETLEGNLRGVLAKMTPEEVNEDRLKFAENLAEEAEEDLNKLGLMMDTLKIQNVSDDTGYLDSIGRKKTAEILKQAEVAEAENKSDAQVKSAEARQRGKVAEAMANKEIAIAENELRVKQAELASEAMKAEERANVAGETAKALAQQELQNARKELEKRRLEADVIVPAEADKQAKELKAKGDAAKIIEDGRANVEIMRMMREEFLAAGNNAKDIFLLQKLESIINMVTNTVSKVPIEKVTIVDSGQGGAIPKYLSSMPAAVTSILEQLKTSTGIDVVKMLENYTDKTDKN